MHSCTSADFSPILEVFRRFFPINCPFDSVITKYVEAKVIEKSRKRGNRSKNSPLSFALKHVIWYHSCRVTRTKRRGIWNAQCNEAKKATIKMNKNGPIRGENQFTFLCRVSRSVEKCHGAAGHSCHEQKPSLVPQVKCKPFRSSSQPPITPTLLQLLQLLL
jgi:hypothetical protein